MGAEAGAEVRLLPEAGRSHQLDQPFPAAEFDVDRAGAGCAVGRPVLSSRRSALPGARRGSGASPAASPS
ncbi:MAG TPA: hypothetical protein VE547_16985, partial [Mycobacteriales bacterium]|nr:hypothetical protein [Mycobacteriales bacterium]